jgi:UDP-N-acetylmuramoyl-tripeptide--D-alanyl-D-alanine ligase
MKPLLKYFLKHYLKTLVVFVLQIHKPVIIAIAGSTNKTFTKQALIRSLSACNIDFRANPNSFNTEIGLPLAILNLPSGYHSHKQWLPVISKSFKCIFQKFPKYLILELGVSDKGDMKYLLKMIKPSVAVITDISQRYLESFSGMDELSDEYGYLINKIEKKGILVINNDNTRIRSLIRSAQGKVITFGFDPSSDYRALDQIKTVHGQEFNISVKGESNHIQIPFFGVHHIYSSLAALIISSYVNKAEKI